MFPKTFIPESHPNVVLVQVSSTEYVAFDVIDASYMTREEEISWKQENVNYGATEPLNKYFLLKVSEIILKNPPESDEELNAFMANCILTAANYWHDHYVTLNS
jgi:hypothetical protein